MEVATSIDSTDKRILSALANSGSTDLQQIAGKVGVPYSTAVRRIRNLESIGVIGGYLTSINPELLNREAYRMLIHSGTSSKQASEKMRAIVERDSRATFFVECLGPWEFEIGWELESAAELSGITAEISSTLTNRFVQVTVLNELSDLKWSFFPSEGVVV
jgi:DNA-binding Lrp family transcriptional regulator